MKPIRAIALCFISFIISISSISSLDFKSVTETVQNDDYDAFTRLIANSTDANAVNDQKISILLWISGIASPKYIKYLISKGAKLNNVPSEDTEWSNYSPLMIAAWGGNLELLKFYESQGLSIDYKTSTKPNEGSTAMDVASMEGRIDIVKYLYPKITNKSRAGFVSYLFWAINHQRTEVAKYLIAQGVPIDDRDPSYGWTVLHEITSNPNPELFNLLKNRQDVDWNTTTSYLTPPIFYTIGSSYNMTKALLEKKVKLDGYDDSKKANLLQLSVKSGNVFTTQLLMSAGLDPNKKEPKNGLTAIEYANQNDRKWMVPILTKKTIVPYPKWTLEDEVSTKISFSYTYQGNLELKSIGGTDSKLSNYWGSKTVLLNIWASWCPPCISEMPSLQAFYNKNKAKGLEVLAQSVDETLSDASNFMKSNNLTFPLFSADFAFTNGGKSPYPSSGIPTSYLIDKNGMVAGYFNGSRDWSKPDLQRFLDVVMAIPKWY